MGATILVADDDRAIRTVLTQALARQGYEVRTTGNGSTLWRWVEDGLGDLVITDVRMPDADGLDLVPRIRRARPDLPVIVITAQSTLGTAVRAAERGAFEYFPKPFDLRTLMEGVARGLSARLAPGAAAARGPQPPDGSESDDEGDDGPRLIGRSPAMQEIYRVLARLVATDLTVMIMGESGTGKELVARALHRFGQRREGPFVALNMAAIPRDLIESELFGHEKGAFTGAGQRTPGRFEQAQGGTLFLDEIGDMPLEAQTRLLRVLQEGEYTTVGGRTPIRADSRIVAATHRDLKALIRAGTFREDLYYRLNVVPIRLPPLRERPEDVPALAAHFLRRAARDGLPGRSFSAAALERLKAYPWPGNVRELENLCRRLAALSPQPVLDEASVAQGLAEVPPPAPPASQGARAIPESESLSEAIERHLRQYFEAHRGALPPAGLYDRVLREMERPLIGLALAATRGNQIKAAALLGLNRNTLRKKIRDLDVQVVRGGS